MRDHERSPALQIYHELRAIGVHLDEPREPIEVGILEPAESETFWENAKRGRLHDRGVGLFLNPLGSTMIWLCEI